MYTFLQNYWWFLVSLLGALFVFLMFVQGGQTLLWALGKNEQQRRMLLISTGRKWELTFTTLVVFGGAFFASFPLFYSTSFGGAYWVWMLILLCFVIQAVSYEFQLKKDNLLGTTTYRVFLMANGILGPLLVGTAVSTFFTGAEFVVDKGAIADPAMPVISTWANAAHGLEAALVPWNLCLGLAVLFLTRCLACLYFLGNIGDAEIRIACRKRLPLESVLFLFFFLVYFIHWLVADGYAVNPDTGLVYMEECKHLHNLSALPGVTVMLVLGIVLVLIGLLRPLVEAKHYGIWFAGTGTVLTVLSLLLCAGWNHTAYYPSTADLQSSLTLANSCSSEFTLTAMTCVSLIIPFVIAYIVWAWHALDKSPVIPAEAEGEE